MSSFIKGILAAVDLMKENCIPVLVIGLGASIIWKSIKGLYSEEEAHSIYTPWINFIFILVAITLYKDVMDVLSIGIEEFTQAITPSKDIYRTLAEISQANGDQNARKTWELMLSDDNSTIWSWLIGGLAQGAMGLIRMGFEVARVVAIGFCYIIGPFAIALSMSPGFEGSARKWFMSYFHVQLWAVTIKVLDLIITLYNKSYTASEFQALDTVNPHNSLDHGLEFLVLQLVIIGMYIMVPVLTSWYIGHQASAGFMGGLASSLSSVKGGVKGVAKSASSMGRTGESIYNSAKAGYNSRPVKSESFYV